jgi:hypothetical protein
MSTVAKIPDAVPMKDRTSKDIRRELAGLIAQTAELLQRMAFLVAELESRGEDLSGLRISLLPALRLVAAGRMTAETALWIADRPWLTSCVGSLSKADQQTLQEKGTVAVLIDGKVRHESILKLPFATVQQVFANGRIRTPEEQRLYLAAPRRRGKRTDEPRRNWRARADRDRGGIQIGNMFVPTAEIVAALAELNGPLEVLIPDEAETCTVRVTGAEKDRIKAAERKQKLPEWHIVRQALHAAGII